MDIWSQTIRRQFNALEKLPIDTAQISEPKILLEDVKVVSDMYLGQDSYLYCKASGTLTLLHVMYDELYEAEAEVQTCIKSLNLCLSQVRHCDKMSLEAQSLLREMTDISAVVHN